MTYDLRVLLFLEPRRNRFPGHAHEIDPLWMTLGTPSMGIPLSIWEIRETKRTQVRNVKPREERACRFKKAANAILCTYKGTSSDTTNQFVDKHEILPCYSKGASESRNHHTKGMPCLERLMQNSPRRPRLAGSGPGGDQPCGIMQRKGRYPCFSLLNPDREDQSCYDKVAGHAIARKHGTLYT